MNRDYIEIKYGDKPIIVATIKSGSVTDYLKLKKEAEQNLAALISENNDVFNLLVDRVNELEKEVKHLKGED